MPTNNQLAKTFDVSARHISKSRRDNRRLLNPVTHKMQKMPPVHTQNTSHINHRWGHKGDMKTLSGNLQKGN